MVDEKFDPVRARANGYDKAAWDEVSDNPEWTEADFAAARPFPEVFPDLAESIRRDRERSRTDSGVSAGPGRSTRRQSRAEGRVP